MEAFNAHDVDALVELYETDAVLVPQAGQRATGRKEIREALTGFVSAFNSIELSARGIVEQAVHRPDLSRIYPPRHRWGRSANHGGGPRNGSRAASALWFMDVRDR